MSVANSAVAANAKTGGAAMALPNVPRLTADEKSRAKYLSDYEKFEPELHKHHLGNPGSTNTLGLKDVPADFDRRLPSLNDPTAAEMEYARQHPNRTAGASSKTGQRANAAGDAGAAGRSTPPPPSTSKGRTGATPPPRSTSPGLSGATEGLEEGEEEEKEENGAADVDEQEDDGAAGRQKARVESATSMAAKKGLTTKGAPTKANARRGEAAATVAAAPLSPTTFTVAAGPSAPKRQATKTPSLALHGSTTSRNVNKATKTDNDNTDAGPVSPVQKRAPIRSPRPAAGKAHASASKSKVASPSPPRGTAPAATARRPYSASPQFDSIAIASSRRGASALKGPATAESSSRVLAVLLDPLPQYMSGLDLDLQSFDLDWMRDGRPVPSSLTTLANLRPGADAGAHTNLNSPRSVLTLLVHGASLKDWQASKLESESVPRDLAGHPPRLQAELRERRQAHAAAQREALRSDLERYYNVLCDRVPLSDLLAAYEKLRMARRDPDAVLDVAAQKVRATAALQRQERQRHVLETNQLRAVRQMQQAQEVLERAEAAEQRQRAAEAEAEAERQQKAAGEERDRREQLARREERRLDRARREEVTRAELQRRLELTESRGAVRAAARERQQHQLQQEREAKAIARTQRLERNTAALGVQAAEEEERRLAKAQKMEEVRLQRETRLAEEQQQQIIRQRRAAVQRKEAKQRAAAAEAELRGAAEERQARAEARLAAFYASRREEAVERAAQEAAQERRMQETRALAQSHATETRNAIESRLREHEDRYQDARSRQMAELAWHREEEREAQEEKAYTLLQQHRLAEYEKLHTVVDLMEKRQAADAVVRQRELMYNQAMRDRDKLRQECDALKSRVTTT